VTYDEAMELVGWLNNRFRKAGMRQPWYIWAVDLSWGKLRRWRELLVKEEK